MKTNKENNAIYLAISLFEEKTKKYLNTIDEKRLNNFIFSDRKVKLFKAVMKRYGISIDFDYTV